MAYLKAEASLELVGSLSLDVVTGLQLELSTDADWNGDACTTRSVSGMHLELVNVPSRVEIFRPISNFVQHGRERGGRPQPRIEACWGERIPLVCLVDNQQAITAVKRRNSKRLRCLNRTHRIAIGSLHEIVGDERQLVEIRYIESELQKGNIYTKAMVLVQFSAERLLIGMQRPCNHSNS